MYEVHAYTYIFKQNTHYKYIRTYPIFIYNLHMYHMHANKPSLHVS